MTPEQFDDLAKAADRVAIAAQEAGIAMERIIELVKAKLEPNTEFENDLLALIEEQRRNKHVEDYHN